MKKQGIPTKANGYQMRSRLEAKWAHFFDLIGWKWEYEPFDANGYIPDFLIFGERPFLVEVKPATNIDGFDDASEKAQRSLRDEWSNDILYVGVTPFLGDDCCSWGPGHGPIIGRLDEWSDDASGWIDTHATFGLCTECAFGGNLENDFLYVNRGFAIGSCTSDYSARPCDHNDGNPPFLRTVHINQFVRSLWADACNESQWKP